MNGPAVPVTDATEPGPRRGVRCGLLTAPLAPPRALALFGLTLAGAVLLAVMTGPVAVGVIGLAGVLREMGRHHLSLHGGSGQALLALLIGLGSCCLILPAALLATRRLLRGTRRLLAQWCGVTIRQGYRPRPPGSLPGRLPGTTRLGYWQRLTWLLADPATWADVLWLPVSLVAGPVLLLGPIGLTVGGVVALADLQHTGAPRIAWAAWTVVVVLAATSAPWTLRAYAHLARLVLAPSEQAELELRVAHLAQTRQESLDGGAAELRRIERDLHDGAQARLVAMGLTLDAAGRLIDTDQAAARALLIEARDASARALAELRDLVRGVHPPVLADRGLADAVRALALDAPVRATVTGTLDGRPPAPVESAAYFAVSELLANVAKHAGARSAEIDLRHYDGALRISVRDDGAGGADPSLGTGLVGIERRLAAFDGVLAIASPAGGPTVITLDVPCALEVPCAL